MDNTATWIKVNKAFKYSRVLGTGFSFAVFGLGAFLIGLGLLLIVMPLPIRRQQKRHWTRQCVWRSTWLYVRMMRALGLLTFEFQNTEALQHQGQLIIANHPSLLDAIFLMSSLPNANCIVKSAMAKNPFTFALVSLAGYISNSDNGEALIEKAANVLRQGQTLIVFPEGTRTRQQGELLFRRGAANIALKARCPVRPVLINCKPMTLRKHEKWYAVPDSPPHFVIKALDALDVDASVDRERPSAVQARQLTRRMLDTFDAQLHSQTFSTLEASGSHAS